MQLLDDLGRRQRSWHIQYVETDCRWIEETRDVVHIIWNLCEAQIEQGVCQVQISFESATSRWVIWTVFTELKLLVKDCGYADPDEMVRDRVVIGCYSSKAREKLIHEGSDLILEKAIYIART